MDFGYLIVTIMTFFRSRRLQSFVKAFPDLATLSVLDIGGRPFMWEVLKQGHGVMPKQLILLNTESEVQGFTGYETAIGDGRQLSYPDKSFDLIFSNSVIEHVGIFDDMRLFTSECLRVGKEVYIQTPNRWFPIKPHTVTIFLHWFPRPIFRRLAFLSLRRLSLFGEKEQFYRIVDGFHLLSRKRLKALFPMKKLWTERFLGLPKSFIVCDRALRHS